MSNASPGVQRTRRHGKYREAVMRDARGICHICGEGAADAIDHIVPVAWGGSDDPRNLAPAHTSCNSRKRDARPDAWTYAHPAMWLDGFGPNSGDTTEPHKRDRKRTATSSVFMLALLLTPFASGFIAGALSLTSEYGFGALAGFMGIIGIALLLPALELSRRIVVSTVRAIRVLVTRARSIAHRIRNRSTNREE